LRVSMGVHVMMSVWRHIAACMRVYPLSMHIHLLHVMGMHHLLLMHLQLSSMRLHHMCVVMLRHVRGRHHRHHVGRSVHGRRHMNGGLGLIPQHRGRHDEVIHLSLRLRAAHRCRGGRAGCVH